MAATIGVCDYGSGNLHSVTRALERVGASVRVAEEPAALAGADAIVIPGVGHFGQCVRAFAQSAELTIHAHLRYGRSPHHICEATFKALAKALGDACVLTGRGGVPSTKGTLSG